MNTKAQEEMTETLNEVGLRDEEVRVYRTVLSLGSRPASVIAQRSGLKRAHTYNILENLIEKGIVQEFVKNSVKHFTCSPPNSLLSIVERREEELRKQKERLEQVIPLLEKLQSPLASRPNVRFFQGVEGIKQIFSDMLLYPDSDILGVVDVAYNMTFAKQNELSWIERFIHERAEKNIWWKGIVNLSPETERAIHSRSWLKRELRFVQNLELPVEIDIYGPKVAITSTHTEVIGVLIENENIANTLRNIHRAAWQLLPEYPRPAVAAPR